MSPEERETMIARYRAGPDVIDAALAGMTATEWDTAEAPGEWSPRQVASHLADAETIGAVRLRQVLAERNPRIQSYEPDELSTLLRYDRDTAISLALFRATRASVAELLLAMTDADWQRQATHSELGPYTVDDWLGVYGPHADEHVEQITRARAAARA